MDEVGISGRWFAANLKAAREKAALSQREMAQRMQEAGWRWHPQTVSRAEAGERVVGIEEAYHLARIAGTDLNALVRPPQITRDAMVLRGATNRLRGLHDDLMKATREYEQAREGLETLLASLRDAGKAGEMAEEFRQAELALKGQ